MDKYKCNLCGYVAIKSDFFAHETSHICPKCGEYIMPLTMEYNINEMRRNDIENGFAYELGFDGQNIRIIKRKLFENYSVGEILEDIHIQAPIEYEINSLLDWLEENGGLRNWLHDLIIRANEVNIFLDSADFNWKE